MPFGSVIFVIGVERSCVELHQQKSRSQTKLYRFEHYRTNEHFFTLLTLSRFFPPGCAALYTIYPVTAPRHRTQAGAAQQTTNSHCAGHAFRYGGRWFTTAKIDKQYKHMKILHGDRAWGRSSDEVSVARKFEKTAMLYSKRKSNIVTNLP